MPLNQNKVLDILKNTVENENKVISLALENNIQNYTSLLNAIFLKERQNEVKFLKQMIELLESQGDLNSVKNTFKKHLMDRVNNKENNCLSPTVFPQSFTNKLYWEWVLQIFEPKTLREALQIFGLKNSKLLSISIQISDIIPPEYDTKEKIHKYLKNIKNNWKVDFRINTLEYEGFSKVPTRDFFEQHLLINDIMFDVATLQNLSIAVLSTLMEQLSINYSLLYKRLLEHNETIGQLAKDVALYQKKRCPLREALLELSQELRSGGERMTGNKYASSAATEGLANFISYLQSFSLEEQKKIMGLYNNASEIKKSLEEKLQEYEKEGGDLRCVEVLADYITVLFNHNKNNALLDLSPEKISLDELKNLHNRYDFKNGKGITAKHNPAHHPLSLYFFPQALIKSALTDIIINTADDLITCLINFPAELYESLLPNLTISDPNIIFTLIDYLNLFNPEQQKILHKAILSFLKKNNYEILKLKSNHGNTPLHWLILIRKIDTIKIVMEALSSNESAFLEILTDRNDDRETPLDFACASKSTEVLNAILQALSANQDAFPEVFRYIGMDLLYSALTANNTEAVNAILKTLSSNTDRFLEFLKCQHIHNNTPLHWAITAKNTEAVNTILLALSSNPKALLQILNTQNASHHTPLHLVNFEKNLKMVNAIFLALVANQEEFLELSMTQAWGWELLFLDIAIEQKNIEMMKSILKALSSNQAVLLTVFRRAERNPLYGAITANNTEAMNAIMEAVSVNQEVFLKVLKLRSVWDKNTPLYWAIKSNNTEAVDAILEAVSSNPVALLQVLTTNNAKYTGDDNNPVKLAVSPYYITVLNAILRVLFANPQTFLTLLMIKNWREELDCLLDIAMQQKNIGIMMVIKALSSNQEALSSRQIPLPSVYDRTYKKLLLSAIKSNNTEALNAILLALSSNPKALLTLFRYSDLTGSTPLYCAIKSNNTEAVNAILLALSSNQKALLEVLKYNEINGNTPLHCAIKANNTKAVNAILLALSSNKEGFLKILRHQNCDGDYPLNLAIASDNTQVVNAIFQVFSPDKKVLRELLTTKSRTDTTPLQLALEAKNNERQKEVFTIIRMKIQEINREKIKKDYNARISFFHKQQKKFASVNFFMFHLFAVLHSLQALERQLFDRQVPGDTTASSKIAPKIP